MAFTSSAQWNVSTGGDATQGGGFDPGVSGFPADGAATSATGSSPVFSSASYTFVAGDVGAWVYIKSGTNWTPGWYKIASVASGAATLSAAAGAALLAAGTLSTAAGCATTASPTAATWGLDYSQSDTAAISFTDMVIDATTNTKFTSAAHPVGVNFIGNVISVNSGTGFTAQRVAVISTSGAVATCDKALGTTSSTGGNGKLGGAVAAISTANSVAVANNTVNIKSGTYTQTASLAILVATITWKGYGASFSDGGTKPLITTATNSVDLFSTQSNSGTQMFDNLSLSNTAATRANGIVQLGQHGNVQYWIIRNCTFDGFTVAVNSDNVGAHFDVSNIAVIGAEIKNSSNQGIASNTGQVYLEGSYLHDGSCVYQLSCSTLYMVRSIVAGGSTAAVNLSANAVVASCVIANSAGKGLWGSTSAAYTLAYNTIFYGNVNGIFFSGTGNTVTASAAMSRNNAFKNTSGNANWAGSPGDVTLTADPFTNAAAGDYSLNSASGGGALLKGAGYPSAFPGGTSTGSLDIGPVQSPASSGGSSSGGGSYVFVT